MMGKQNLEFRKKYKSVLSRLTFIIILVLVSFNLLNLQLVRGQSADQGWTIPTNLSHSGATTSPAMVIDNNKVIHVIWQDNHASLYYADNIGNRWSTPKIVKFPFGNTIPRFLTDSKGQIYAFWTNDQGSLYSSTVPQNHVGDSSAWSEPQWIADSAVIADAVIDPQNQVHIAYVTSSDTGDFPAGVYYRHSSLKGTWFKAIALYVSPYLRHLSEPMANIQISSDNASSPTQLYVVWDNPARKQIYMVKSVDDGNTWGNPVEIDGPKANSTSLTPLKIRSVANNNNVMLIWQVGELPTASNHEGTSTGASTISEAINCTQHFQISSDGGKTWSKNEEILKDIKACVQDYQFFSIGNDVTLLMLSTTQNQVFLVAWDGKTWSTPQSQTSLSSFEDPEIFNSVNYDCRQANQIGNEELVVVGCDKGGGGDIWTTSRKLGSLKDWFPPPPVWSAPVLVATSQSAILSPNAVAGPGEQFNAFWNQADETNPNTQAIYYSSLVGTHWSRPVGVLSSPEGKTEEPAVKLDPKGRLIVTWSGGKSGQVYFSWANPDGASNKSEWALSQEITTPGQNATSPDIIETKQGRIYIVYAIPLNEHRGIYINWSTDNGETWSGPVKVFDAAAGGWEMVNQPQLVIAPDGSLHVFWTRYTLPGGDGPLGLYEARSDNNGGTWSSPTTMVEGSVDWSQAFGSDQDPMQLVWIEQISGREVIKRQFSLDNGQTWNRTASISHLTNIQGQPGATTDGAGRLHLLVVTKENNNNLLLNHLMWDGQQWISDDNYEISQDPMEKVSLVAAGITQAGKLNVIISGMTINNTSNLSQFNLVFTSRSVDVPKTEVFGVLPTNSSDVPTLIERTPGPTSTPIPTLTPTPTPNTSISIPISQIQGGSPPSSNNYLGLALGAGIALLMAIIFLGFRLRSIRSGKG
jgi:hypothetical protein